MCRQHCARAGYDQRHQRQALADSDRESTVLEAAQPGFKSEGALREKSQRPAAGGCLHDSASIGSALAGIRAVDKVGADAAQEVMRQGYLGHLPFDNELEPVRQYGR